MGYSAATTVLSAAASHDLTDLATVKDELSIKALDTASDTWLRRAITQVSKSIAIHTNRVFAPEQICDAFDVQQDPYPYQTPGGFSQLALTRYPLLGVAGVIQTLAPANGSAPATTQTLAEATDFRVDAASGQLLRLNSFTGAGSTWDAAPVSVVYTAGYGVLQNETHAVPAAPGPYTVTAGQASTFSCDHQVAGADGSALTRVTGAPAAGQYAVSSAGVYTFNAADAGRTLTFRYATLAVPEDLVEIALRLINARFRSRDRDPALVQQETPGVGVQRWWFGGAPGQKGPFAPDIEAALEAYRTPVVV